MARPQEHVEDGEGAAGEGRGEVVDREASTVTAKTWKRGRYQA